MTIKETAGKIILYLYKLQRSAPLTMDRHQVGFIDKKEKGIALTSDKSWITSDLQGINSSATDIFNAFYFLVNKNLIKSVVRVTPNARVYVGVLLTDNGVDVVEGIERGREGAQDFEKMFNMTVKGTSVDSMVKEHLGSLSD